MPPGRTSVTCRGRSATIPLAEVGVADERVEDADERHRGRVGPEPFTTVLEGSGERANSTTMAFVRILNALVRDPALGERSC